MFFRTYFPKAEYLGLDISKESIDVARDRNIDNVEFASYDGIDLPLDDRFFDITFIASVLHHVKSDSHRRVLEEAKRVLRLGGRRLYIFEHYPFNLVTRRIVRDCPFDDNAVLLKPAYASASSRK